MVIMVDDEDRENEGDLVCAARLVTPQMINFMTKEARGLVCLALDANSVEKLKLPMMEDSSRRIGNKSTAFTVSIEARSGVTTGISAADRAHTIQVATDPESGPEDIVVPGHVFPLKARSGGVLERGGHTEGSVDLTFLAGLDRAAVICEIMNDDGTMARRDDLHDFSMKHDLPILTIADLIAYRLMQESLVKIERRAPFLTSHGTFEIILFRSLIDQVHHIALVKGAPSEKLVTDVRVHRQRQLSDLFATISLQGPNFFSDSLKMLERVENGVLLYLVHPQDPSDILKDFERLTLPGQPSKPKHQEQILAPTWMETDPRTLGLGAQILRLIGVRKMRVHMTRPVALKGLLGYGLEVTETIPMSQSSPL
jgi:3,4-dihydroxy 2-butanone 4-phosphate synthase/GTP cyclohydrolase II